MDRILEARHAPDLAVLEGFHALKHALRFGAEILEVVAGDPAHLEQLASELAPDLQGRFLELATEAGLPKDEVLTVARRPPFDLGLALRRPGPVVFLEQPRHLGNLGAAIRGAAGLHFALPVARVDAPPAAADRPLVAIDPDGDERKVPGHSILAFGSERHGLSDALLAAADARIRIPMRAGVSSLNLATSVAAVLYGLIEP